ncbi:nitrile hydratase subunit beta [Vibrio sp.]|uniref:Nitrile hydratase subunit beta n=1 Tax=Vibrio viridaestus TaxID=2487322 RepID=A0A3N9TKK8_9VIBR|nr:SH3-like domain-containing protein [Vibrio viridaestus]MDC0611744.1 nitrile hydratase subunit beta [Vibrio sp.]RQW64524.1 nitrile hydratase subunit beta [Vibrio viridaestus]
MPISANEVIDMIMNSKHPEHTSEIEPRFQAGDRVRVTKDITYGHTRVPSYLRGRVGTVKHLYGIYIFADTRAHGKGACPEPLYSVHFDKDDVWGEGGDTNTSIRIDMYDSYLEEI